VKRFRVPEIAFGVLFGIVISLFAAGVGPYQTEQCVQAEPLLLGQTDIRPLVPRGALSASADPDPPHAEEPAEASAEAGVSKHEAARL
jgi:hypothetical protein